MALLMTHQLRAARAMLRWEQEQLARAAGVAIGTVKRIEGMDGTIRAQLETVQKLQRALEAAGVEFIAGGARRREKDAGQAEGTEEAAPETHPS